MKKILSLITALCLLTSILCFNAACSTVTEWAEDHPTEANLAKAGLLTGLNFFLANNPDYAAYEAPLRGAIHLALSEAQSPEEAAAILDSSTLEILDDPDVRSALLAAWQAQLDRSTLTPEGVPASGPAVDYARSLRNALSGYPQSAIRNPQSQTAQPYVLGTNYQAPAWAADRWGEHWSDPLWSATSFFSGCESYASFRAWHATPTEPAIDAQWQDRQEQFDEVEAQLARLH